MKCIKHANHFAPRKSNGRKVICVSFWVCVPLFFKARVQSQICVQGVGALNNFKVVFNYAQNFIKSG